MLLAIAGETNILFLYFFNYSLLIILKSDYSLEELVRPGENGMIFKSGRDLSDQLLDWFRGFPLQNEARRLVFKSNLQTFQNRRWHQSWKEIALPQFSTAVTQ